MANYTKRSLNELKHIHLCDSSYLSDGYSLLLNNFENAQSIDDIDDSMLSVPFHHEDSSLKLLYHYTNADAFLNIIRSSDIYGKTDEEEYDEIDDDMTSFLLRFSRVDFMNDIHDGGEMFNMIINECFRNETISISESLKKYIENMIEERHIGKYSNTKRVSYICSLTVDGDSLPIWRGYSSGGGYNLKLSSKVLQEQSRDGYLPDVQLIPVIYDCDVMVKIVKTFLEKISIIAHESYNKIDGMLNNFIFENKLSFKHPSFSHEQEVRLVKNDTKRLYDVNPFEQFSETNAILRPYTNVNILKKALIGVTVGPLLEASTAKRLVEDMILRYFGSDYNCQVDISAAPIRF